MKIIKKKENFIYNLVYKIKKLFVKKNKKIENIDKENIAKQQESDMYFETLTEYKKYIPSEELIDTITKFENNQNIISELTDEQIKELIKYYIEKNKELDRELEYKKKKFDDLVKKLKNFCEKSKSAK